MSDEGERLDADRIEEEWSDALDAASDAVGSTGRARAVGATDLAATSETIQSQRTWLRGFRPTLQKLFPRRRSDAG
jgi:hypothetical protein